jgi:hypothetical protein
MVSIQPASALVVSAFTNVLGQRIFRLALLGGWGIYIRRRRRFKLVLIWDAIAGVFDIPPIYSRQIC